MRIPTTGITKKPATAPRAPATRVLNGAPRADAERAGRTYLTSVPTASIAVSRTRTVQRTGPPPSASVHHSPASQMSSNPGTIGSSTPTRPISMTAATAVCASFPTGLLTAVGRPPPRAGDPGHGLAAAAAGARAEGGAHAAQVQGDEEQAQEHQRLRREGVRDGGVRPVQDEREREDHGTGESEHRWSSLKEVDPRV